jgi:hypothetical protein
VIEGGSVIVRSHIRRLAVASLGAVSLLIGGPGLEVRAGDVQIPETHQHVNSVEGVLTSNADGSIDGGGLRNVSGLICSAGSTGANADTTCEGVSPSNETSIAVNPTNSQNVVGSANDYQLTLSSGGTIFETVYSRAHVSFDGGRSWAEYGVQYPNYTSTGDPGVAFDASGRAYLSTLGFSWSQNRFCCVNPDVLVATSTTGGKSWTMPARVAIGSGTFGSPGTFNDKEEIAAWGNGNAIVTWTVFNDGQGGSYISSPIFASVTHDGGNTWSAGVPISGSASFCIGAQGGNTCDQDQGSVPVVAADGSIYVSFLNTADLVTGRDQYLVVKVDPTSGQRVGGPFRVSSVFDGFTDYPINEDGRQTYQDSEFRSWAFGPIAADPTNASHLAVVWSDMRNSQLPAPSDPYGAVTNSDVIVSQSFDRGASWSAPTALNAPGDQFQPWAAYDGGGHLRIGYFDRSYDPANHQFGYTLATESRPGSLRFSTNEVSGVLSNPTQGDRWFSGRTPNPAFPHPSSFLGDYSGIAISGGAVVSLWTDTRDSVCFTTRCGHTEDAFFGTAS